MTVSSNTDTNAKQGPRTMKKKKENMIQLKELNKSLVTYSK